MIPIRDNNLTRRKPIVTWAFIAVNVAVYIILLLKEQTETREIIMQWGLIPQIFKSEVVSVLTHHDARISIWFTPFTSMFLHGGFLHLIGNTWFLHIFGDNVEDRLGRIRYIFFYICSGLGAAFAQLMIDSASELPMIGASGAISGVLAAYLVLYPRTEVVVLFPIFIFVQLITLPAVIVVGAWFLLQVLAGFSSLASARLGGGVAWWAHIGGFLVGLIVIKLILPKKKDH